MSLYDNFHAPQYVDFSNLHLLNNDGPDSSAFFNSALDMDSFLKLRDTENSRLSSFSSTSENERTLTPTASNSTFGEVNTTVVSSTSSAANTPPSSSHCAVPPRSNTPLRSALNKSKGRGIHLDLTPKKVNWELSRKEGNKCGEAYGREEAHKDEQKTHGTTSGSENKQGECHPVKSSDSSSELVLTVNIIPPTPTSLCGALDTSTPLASSTAVTKSRENGQAARRQRRSRSAGPPEASPCTEEEMLLNALDTLKLSGTKVGRASMSANLNQTISPQALSSIISSKKTPKKESLQLEGKQPAAKRKLSPASRLIRDSCHQPEKFISMAEQIARIQKNTPTRFRTVPKSANLKQAVQSKVARNMRFHHKEPPKNQKSNDMPNTEGNQEIQKSKKQAVEKGVKVARWAPPKVEPYKFTESKQLPKKIFSFDTQENLLLRDRRTPIKRMIPTTKVQPFSFDKRDQEIIKRKVERLKGVAASSNIQSTKPAVRQRSKSHSGEILGGTDKLVHHARVPVVLYKAPFQPHLPHHKTTVPAPVKLSTEIRAKEREQFEEHLRKKEEMRSAALHELHERKRQEEEREIQQLRKVLVHKANPMPEFRKQFKVKPSTAPLTSPHTPTFLHRRPAQKSENPSDLSDEPMDC